MIRLRTQQAVLREWANAHSDVVYHSDRIEYTDKLSGSGTVTIRFVTNNEAWCYAIEQSNGTRLKTAHDCIDWMLEQCPELITSADLFALIDAIPSVACSQNYQTGVVDITAIVLATDKTYRNKIQIHIEWNDSEGTQLYRATAHDQFGTCILTCDRIDKLYAFVRRTFDTAVVPEVSAREARKEAESVNLERHRRETATRAQKVAEYLSAHLKDELRIARKAIARAMRSGLFSTIICPFERSHEYPEEIASAVVCALQKQKYKVTELPEDEHPTTYLVSWE